MTSVLVSTTDAVVLAARAVLDHVDGTGEKVATPTRDVAAFATSASALVATVEGARNGQLTLAVVDAAWLAHRPPAEALREALVAAAAALGSSLVEGTVQVLEPGLAVNAALADPSSVVVRLECGSVVGVVAARLEDAVAARTTAKAGGRTDIDPRRLHMLRGVEMTVTAEIGRTRMTVGELLGLTEGAVVELDRPAGSPADLLVNGRLIARGEIVVVDESFALRITDLVGADEER